MRILHSCATDLATTAYRQLIMKIGIVGFSSSHFDQKTARVLLEKKLKEIISDTDIKTIEIVSGYTNIGIPKIAYELSDNMGLKTIGFSAKKALTASCGLYSVDKAIIYGKDFGDESQAFVNYIDILIRIGGGKQSRKEVELFKEKNKDQDISKLLFEEEIEWYGK